MSTIDSIRASAKISVCSFQYTLEGMMRNDAKSEGESDRAWWSGRVVLDTLTGKFHVEWTGWISGENSPVLEGEKLTEIRKRVAIVMEGLRRGNNLKWKEMIFFHKEEDGSFLEPQRVLCALRTDGHYAYRLFDENRRKYGEEGRINSSFVPTNIPFTEDAWDNVVRAHKARVQLKTQTASLTKEISERVKNEDWKGLTVLLRRVNKVVRKIDGILGNHFQATDSVKYSES